MRPFRILATLLRGHSGALSVVKVVLLRALALAVTVLTGMLTAHSLGPAGRGEQAAIAVAPGFLAGLAVLGLHASLIYNMKADPDHEREYIGADLILTGASGTLAAAIGWIVEPYWLAGYSAHDLMVARLLLLTTPFTAMTWGLTGVAEAHGRFGFANRILYLQNLGVLAALVVLRWAGLLTPGTSAAAYALPTLPAFAYFAWATAKRTRPALTLRPPFPGRLLRYGLRFYGWDLLGTLSGYLDQLLVVALLAPGLVGLYAVAQSLTVMLGVLHGAVASVLFPSVAARDASHVVEAVGKTVRLVSAVTAAAALALGVLGPWVLPLLYGAAFAPAVAPFRVLLVNAVIASAARLLFQAYTAGGRPEWVTGLEAAGVAVSSGAMLALAPGFGLMGAAAAALLGSVVRLTLAMAMLPLALKVARPRLILGWPDMQAGMRALRGAMIMQERTP